MMVTIRSKGEGRKDVLRGEFGEICKDLLGAHSCGEPAEHVIDGDAHVPDAWLPSPFSGFDGDAIAVIFHERR